MIKQSFLATCILALSFAGSASAFELSQVEESSLKGYAITLSENISSGQWDNLWRQVNRLNYFSGKNAKKVAFTINQDELKTKVQETLSSSNAITLFKSTEAIYRKNFGVTVGKKGDTELSCVCVVVDWRTVRAGTPTDDARAVASVSLLQSYPCSPDDEKP